MCATCTRQQVNSLFIQTECICIVFYSYEKLLGYAFLGKYLKRFTLGAMTRMCQSPSLLNVDQTLPMQTFLSHEPVQDMLISQPC
jgi:hypothetical protein